VFVARRSEPEIFIGQGMIRKAVLGPQTFDFPIVLENLKVGEGKLQLQSAIASPLSGVLTKINDDGNLWPSQHIHTALCCPILLMISSQQHLM
jgi:hypothetical protein